MFLSAKNNSIFRFPMKYDTMTNGQQKAKHRSVLCLLCLCLLAACHHGPNPDEQALQAAKGYYDELLSGNCEAFLDGKAVTDSLPPDYRSQMLQVYRNFLDEQQENHGGVHHVTAERAFRDTTLHLTHAFLLLHFSDSTREEITVPMVEVNGQWKMK